MNNLPSRPSAVHRPFAVEPDPLPLSEQIHRLRWLLPLTVLLLVFAHQSVAWLLVAPAPGLDVLVDAAIYGLLGPAAVWLALGWVRREVARKESAEAQLTGLNERISFLLKVIKRLNEAPDEAAVAALALQLPAEVTASVVATALIRFDDHYQPMPVEHRGALDEAALVAWHRSLLAQSVRLECQSCLKHTAHRGEACSVFAHLSLPDVERVICLPLRRQARQFAILGLFLTEGQELTSAEHAVLEAVAAEVAVAFENVRLRAHELTTLFDLNEALHLRLGLDGLLKRILTRTVEASRAEAGLLFLREPDGALRLSVTAGEWDGHNRFPLIERLAAGALDEGAGEPILANLQAPDPNTAAVLCAPMLADAGPVGVIVLGSRRPDAFMHSQVRLVSAIASQAALLAENARLYSQLEHQAILAERGRLAREMHDGLAQTLGYLKLRANQIAGWLGGGPSERAEGALRELAQTAGEAYLDLRAALDGLRVPLDAEQRLGFSAELQRLAADFERQSGARVTVDLEAEPELPPSAQVHLRGIVQEALANIRKHARASRVQIRLVRAADRLALSIEDDGQGFAAGQEWPATRHGLRVMQERAALLGADLQVSTAPGAGTRVRLDWPASTISAR